MVVTAVFAVFTGFNDAGAQVGLGTRARGLPPLVALVAGAACRLVRGLPHVGTAGVRLRWLHTAAFSAGCVAYGANDGQKVLAVYFATRDGAFHGAADLAPVLVLLGGCFLVGGLAGLPKLAAGLGGTLTPTRTDTLVATEFTGAGVVLGTAALGAPVSMTQSLAGALIGTGLARGARRVRWRGVLALGRAWLLTLPLAYGLAALTHAAIGVLR
ncbi:phosphate/sulfate permease [Streptosporangium album]|uniref:Phosphate/sulfate permease n=1 Tax=Streptosporangium album TaxID=47479 RepID=A0A7W7S4P7_9ACTN|nr:inorganic phosphate transporter [Streptosporangium album]MBB4943840.1 phosphate/sulfate permease [Streptosporangium album]